MTEEQVIEAIQVTPYLAGGNDLGGMDCWGLVEYWYKEIMGITLTDRCGIDGAESIDFLEGFKRSAALWEPAHVPRVGDVAVMPANCRINNKRQTIENGHCGVMTRHGVLHISETGGARLDSFNSPFLKRVKFMRYVQN